jgi:hypothetical protein
LVFKDGKPAERIVGAVLKNVIVDKLHSVVVSGLTSAISVVERCSDQLMEAVQEVAKVHGALTAVVGHDRSLTKVCMSPRQPVDARGAMRDRHDHPNKTVHIQPAEVLGKVDACPWWVGRVRSPGLNGRLGQRRERGVCRQM